MPKDKKLKVVEIPPKKKGKPVEERIVRTYHPRFGWVERKVTE